MRTTIHLVYKNKMWVFYKEGESAEAPVGTTKTKKAAIVEARRIAKGFYPWGQLIIHKKDGKIQTEYTYGNDPVESEG